MHRSITFLAVMSLFAPSRTSSQEVQDVVYLRNGSIVRGTVSEHVPGESMKVQTPGGSDFVYSVDEVNRMTKEAPGASLATSPSTVSANEAFALSGHVATDVQGGLGFGGGIAYILKPGSASYGHEFGLDYFYHGYKETEEGNTYNTDISVFGLRANWLWNHEPQQNHVYFVTGVGMVIATLNWSNTYDPAVYGYTLTEDADYSSVGNIINLGLGWASSSGFGMRLEAPMLFFYGAGNAATFVPTFSVALKHFF